MTTDHGTPSLHSSRPLLRDEAVDGLLRHLEAQPEGAIEIVVDNGMYRVEVAFGDVAEWAEHPNLTDALSILVGLLDA